MATSEEIIAKIDEYLGGKITKEEAAQWARSELKKTERRGLRVEALWDLILLTEIERARTSREELKYDKDILVKYEWKDKELLGEDPYPCEAFWMAYEPGDRIVTVKILRKGPKERILIFKVRTWEGEILSSHEKPIDVPENCKNLTMEDVRSVKDYIRKHTEDAVTRLVEEMSARCIDPNFPFLLKFYYWVYDPDLQFSFLIQVFSPMEHP